MSLHRRIVLDREGNAYDEGCLCVLCDVVRELYARKVDAALAAEQARITAYLEDLKK